MAAVAAVDPDDDGDALGLESGAADDRAADDGLLERGDDERGDAEAGVDTVGLPGVDLEDVQPAVRAANRASTVMIEVGGVIRVRRIVRTLLARPATCPRALMES